MEKKKRGRPPHRPQNEPTEEIPIPLEMAGLAKGFGIDLSLVPISYLERAIHDGIQCDYIRFQSPIPPGSNTEPVYEFRLEAKDRKYVVEQISHNEHTVYWKFQGRIQETPWVNVQLARPIQ